MMLEENLFAGFGGQGVLAMGKLLAQAAMDQGLCASWLPSYGPEMRGGTANCIVAFSDDEIGSPLAATYDAVVVMNQPSLEKFEPKVKAGGTLVVNSSMIPVNATRGDIEVFHIEANDIAERITGGQRSANIAALGGLHGVRPRLSEDALLGAIRAVFGSKGDKVVSGNIDTFREAVRTMASRSDHVESAPMRSAQSV